jgi:4-hydroxy-tetrahydrodipicolinate reductase
MVGVHKMTKIALIGYGKMGQLIEKIAKQNNHEIVSIIDPYCETAEKEINQESLKDAEVCIDFTHPDVIMGNIKKIASLNKNMVIGTTGWYDKMDEVKKIVIDNNVGLIWSGNFSIGVNALFRIIDHSAKIFNNLEQYDIMAFEIHHNQKADSPSGTANMIGDILLNNISRKNKIVTERIDKKISSDEIHLASIRGGNIPGTHSVLFDSFQDTIEIKHTARNREGFAYGSVLAAEYIAEKKGLFNINDLMDNIIDPKDKI